MERQVVLVTGASGFIGTNLTKRLLEEGCAVIALDREKPRFKHSGYRDAAGPGACCDDFDLLTVEGDIRDCGLLRKIFQRKVHYVVHLAALSTIQLGAENQEETMSVNVNGTETLLRAAKDCGGVKGFLYASTDKVYGNLRARAYTERDPVSPLTSPYDCSKAAADRMVREWSGEYGIHGVVLRFCNIYGKYDLQATRIVPATIQAAFENRDCVLRVYRDGEGHIQNFRRDLLYVEDLCKAIWNIMRRLEVWNEAKAGTCAMWGEAFNLGSRHCYPMDEVVWKIQNLIGRGKSLRVEISEPSVEISHQCMDYSKAHEVFGFSPKTPLEKGLQETVEWWRQITDNGKRTPFSMEGTAQKEGKV